MEFQLAMHKCCVFLVALLLIIFASHLLVSVEGIRPLKPEKVSVSAGKKQVVVLPPTVPLPTKTSSKSDYFESLEGYKNDFRPTTPGNSPGVGHSFADDNQDVVVVEQRKAAATTTSVSQQQQSNHDQKHNSVAAAGAAGKEDFRPTNPGHSPGVGHSFVSTSEPNA